MLSAILSQFGPLHQGIIAPCLMRGKLILQKVTSLCLGWDETLPGDILNEWSKRLELLESLTNVKTK